jgi:hypothetical protein
LVYDQSCEKFFCRLSLHEAAALLCSEGTMKLRTLVSYIVLPLVLVGNVPSHKGIAHGVGLAFRGTDTDRNGCLSRAEWKAAAKRSIARVKSRGASAEGLLHSYMDAFVQLDGDGDGCLTRHEYIRAAQRNFDEWNKDWNN